MKDSLEVYLENQIENLKYCWIFNVNTSFFLASLLGKFNVQTVQSLKSS